MGSSKNPDTSSHVSGQSNRPLSLPAHALTYQALVQEIGANADDGLTAADAKNRLAEFGENELGDAEGVSPVKILVRQVANAMTLVYSSHETSS